MNPWDLFAWVGAFCAAVVVIVITATITAAGVRSIRNPRPAKKTGDIDHNVLRRVK